jgi:DNA-binding NarL/FixJ family response regulator
LAAGARGCAFIGDHNFHREILAQCVFFADVTTVALIEDDADYRAGLERMLAASDRFQLAGSFGSAEDALAQIPRNPPAVILCDINLPGQPGPAAVLRLRTLCPATRCVMLTIFEDAENLFAALQAGASGYLLKSTPPSEILAGLDDVLAGGAPMSRPIARRVLASFAKPAAPSSDERSRTTADVTAREREILDHLARGLAYKEIAAQLGISPATVKNHLARIYEKLEVRSRTEAAVKWLGR